MSNNCNSICVMLPRSPSLKNKSLAQLWTPLDTIFSEHTSISSPLMTLQKSTFFSAYGEAPASELTMTLEHLVKT